MRVSRHRRTTIVLFVIALILPLALPAIAFDDDNNSVHEDNIDYLADMGILSGCNPPDNNLICPNDPLTRGQAATILTRALDLPPGPNAFDDDDGTTHENGINAIAQAGITSGCNPPDNDEFCPFDSLSRAQMATMLIRALDDVSGFRAEIFNDVPRDHTHARGINALAGVGITVGCNPPDNDEFCPSEDITRAQMATFIVRFLRLEDKRPPTVDITSPAHLSTHFTTFNGGTNQHEADITFTASAVDPNGDAIVSYEWFSTEASPIGTGNPLDATLGFPANETSSEPYVSVVVTDSTGLFSGDEIQVKLKLPSP